MQLSRCLFVVSSLLLAGIVGCSQTTTPSTEKSSDKKAAAAEDQPCCESCPCGKIDRKTLLAVAGKDPAPAAQTAAVGAADWPMFGGTPQRNMVNLAAKKIVTDWSVEEGAEKNVKWMAKMGNHAYGGPVIAGGKVYVGTNNAQPRDPAIKERDKTVVMCFSEMSGKLLWQAVHDFPDGDVFEMARESDVGICSTPAVDGDRLYYVTPGCEVVCASTADGKSVWKFDMLKELKVSPYHAANCSPVVVGDLVFVVTGNGVDDEGKIRSPKAPSFLALKKTDGKVAWQSNLPGDKIIEGQWSNPAYAEINGAGQVIFPGGDGWVYSFEPKSGELIWKFNCHPAPPAAGERIRNYIVGTPVVYDNKIYFGMGLYPEHPLGTRDAYFFCVDITKKGDVSPVDFDTQNPKNKTSALVWAYGGPIEPRPKKGRPVNFGRTMSTAAVHDGLVYITEEFGYLHCLDAKTGKKYWEYDFLSAIWGSPYWVDGRIYVGNEDGDIVIFPHGKEMVLKGRDPFIMVNGKAEPIIKIPMEDVVHNTPVAVGNVLYIATRSKLYALSKE